jgi:hypothetical protein
LVPALKTLRPDLDVFTIATPWTGLTVISGFGKGRYDRSWMLDAGQRFAKMEFAAIEANLGEALSLVANEWEPVFARLRANLVGKADGNYNQGSWRRQIAKLMKRL